VEWLAAALLGVVQGLTEFLPVSSSAHLILARLFFGWDPERFGLAFDVACHVGTLVAVLVFFRSDVGELARAVPAALRGPTTPGARRLWLIVAGTVPVVVVGGLGADWIESTLRTPLVAAVALALGAGLLFFVERLGTTGRDEAVLTLGGAVVIGVGQALALVPGVSRSGATIAVGMALGMRRDAAARFGFLLSVPAVLAAAAKKGLELGGAPMDGNLVMLFVVGTATSGVVGYLTVKYFLRFLVAHRLDGFAWYRLALAGVTMVWLATA
jgi:undecaprenyl-diphosphatase